MYIDYADSPTSKLAKWKFKDYKNSQSELKLFQLWIFFKFSTDTNPTANPVMYH